MNNSLPNYFLLLNMIFFFTSLLSASSKLISLLCMLSKKDNHNFEKRRARTNLKINLKMHYNGKRRTK